MGRLFRLMFVVILFLILVIGYFFLYQRVLWLGGNNLGVKIVSSSDLKNYYKEISHRFFGLLLVKYEILPEIINNERRIFSVDDKKNIFWNCSWHRVQIMDIKTPLWIMNVYFNVDEMVRNYDSKASNFIINRNISSCLSNEVIGSEKISEIQLIEFDKQNYEKMKNYHNGQIFELIY